MDDGRVVAVAGGAGDIGLATALRFDARGDRVVLFDADRARLDTALARLGGRALGWCVDVRDAGQVERALAECLELTGGLDVWVHAAGVMSLGGAIEVSEEEWRRTLEVDLTGAFVCARRVARVLRREPPGSMVFIASSAGEDPSSTVGAAYAVAKAGLLMLVRRLALELAPEGIRVNAVSPGVVETAMSRSIPGEARHALLARVPLKRVGRPEDVAAAVTYLCSDEASYVTGATLQVNGGRWM